MKETDYVKVETNRVVAATLAYRKEYYRVKSVYEKYKEGMLKTPVKVMWFFTSNVWERVHVPSWHRVNLLYVEENSPTLLKDLTMYCDMDIKRLDTSSLRKAALLSAEKDMFLSVASAAFVSKWCPEIDNLTDFINRELEEI